MNFRGHVQIVSACRRDRRISVTNSTVTLILVCKYSRRNLPPRMKNRENSKIYKTFTKSDLITFDPPHDHPSGDTQLPFNITSINH